MTSMTPDPTATPDATGESAACVWTPTDDGVWETDCRHAFEFDETAGPLEGCFRFCAYCGRRLEVVRPAAEDDDDD